MVWFAQGRKSRERDPMKKYLAMLCATMLCVCCLGLAACGGSGSGSAAASGSASASASASSSSAAVSYAGDWKFAGMEANMGSGTVTMVGDLDVSSPPHLAAAAAPA